MRNCPTCGRVNGQILHRQPLRLPDQIDLCDWFDVIGCACGMVYNQTENTQEDMDRYYSGPFHVAGRDYLNNKGKLAKTADFLAARLPNNSRVLDVGCADGEMNMQLSQRGFEHLLGIDAEMDWPDEKFDLIILSHVLEHVIHPNQMVKKIRDHLVADGHVYVEVPDANGYVFNRQTSFSYFNFEHVNHYSFGTLNWQMEMSGFGLEMARSEKTVEMAEDWDYPIVGGLWQVDHRGRHYANYSPETTVMCMDEYVQRSYYQESDMLDRIPEGQVFIRGIGHRAFGILGYLEGVGDVNIARYIDSNPRSLTFNHQQVGNYYDIPTIPVVVLGSSHHANRLMAADYPENEVIM